jgi:lipopolysaccharide assembly protein A
MRFVFILLALVFAALGALFGALNSESVSLDFYFAQSQFPKGAAFLCALLLGWLLGGLLVYFSLVPGLRRRVRAQARELKLLNRGHAPQDKEPAVGKDLTVHPISDA